MSIYFPISIKHSFKQIILLFVFLLINFKFFSQTPVFDSFFQNKSLRLNVIHQGNYNSENYKLVNIKTSSYWSGPRKNLIDSSDLGNYRICVFDSLTNTLIYQYNYSCLFFEWQREPEAKTIYRAFEETLVIPYPKSTITIKLENRDKTLHWHLLWSYSLSPKSYLINHDKPFYSFKIDTIQFSGNISKKIDLVFLAEGYTASQMSKFRHDIQRMIRKMAEYEPFKSHMNDFNFWAVESISPDSGCDDPRKNIWKRTLFDAHFNTFNSDRYLTSSSLWTIHEVASVVPYDQIYILTNTDKYGGGGVFNYFSLTSVDHRSSEEVFVHEFGHAFAGLADEYFYLSEENQDYYPRNVEPWEPNITTLVHFETKWKNLVDSKTPVPTPATKYYQTVVGAFEGAGYCSKGVYRPTQSCLMKELKSPFCPICQKAILNRIRFYTDN